MDDLIFALQLIEKWLLSLAIVFWIVETVYFLFKLGWHIRATTEREKMCDEMVKLMLNTWVNLLLLLIALRVGRIIYLAIKIKNNKR